MAAVLIKHNQWLQPDIPFDTIADDVNIANIDDVNTLSDNFICKLITHELGPISCSNISADNNIETLE